MANFVYRERPANQWEKRANQSNSQFISYIQENVRTFTPKGDCWIRILPPTWEGAEHYGMDVWIHYNVGPSQAVVLCLTKMKAQRCPICEAQLRAEAAGREDAKMLKPGKRVLTWIIDRKVEREGKENPLNVWAMPWTVDRDITKVSRDRQTGAIYHLDNPTSGFDVMFDREGDGINTKYTGIVLSRQASSVDEKYLKYIEQNPLPTVLLWRTYEEVNSLYEGIPDVPEPPTETPVVEREQLSLVIPTMTASTTPMPTPPTQFVSEWTGTNCHCGKPQYTLQNGITCENGHFVENMPIPVVPPPPPPKPVEPAPSVPPPNPNGGTKTPVAQPATPPSPSQARNNALKTRFITGQ